MASIVIADSTWSDVPAVDFETTGGDTARYWEAEDGDELDYGVTTSAVVGTAIAGAARI